MVNRLKIVVLGSKASGKTTFIQRHITGDFIRQHKDTMGVDVTPLKLNTNIGEVVLNIWDCGTGNFEGLGEGYWNGADGFLVLFDLTNRKTFKDCLDYLQKIKNQYEEKMPPVVICGNKCDVLGAAIPRDLSKLNKGVDYTDYITISAKSNYNFEKPFLTILRNKFGEDVHWTEW